MVYENYVGFNSPSIIRYLEPLTGDVFTARFADYQFDETVFQSLRGEKKIRANNSFLKNGINCRGLLLLFLI